MQTRGNAHHSPALMHLYSLCQTSGGGGGGETGPGKACVRRTRDGEMDGDAHADVAVGGDGVRAHMPPHASPAVYTWREVWGWV